MCIRDSFDTANVYSVGVSEEILGRALKDFAKRDEVVIATCLLYTSDAADERSSVDLGGRRIIKKKKHTYLYRMVPSKEHIT